MTSSPAALKARNQDRLDDKALKALANSDAIYKSQRTSLTRRLLGNLASPSRQLLSYVTVDELAAIKALAASIGMSMSLLIRITMIELANGYQKPLEYIDPRLDYRSPMGAPEYPDDL